MANMPPTCHCSNYPENANIMINFIQAMFTHYSQCTRCKSMYADFVVFTNHPNKTQRILINVIIVIACKSKCYHQLKHVKLTDINLGIDFIYLDIYADDKAA